jgi:glycerol-3-phosphate acyltransferase PlsY
VAKGFVPTLLAVKYSNETWVIVLTAALAVAGHCWPVFAQFRGGMGLAAFAGALFAVNWFSVIIGLGLLLALLLILRHGARASVLTGILIAPLFWLFNLRGLEFWIALACGLVIAFRAIVGTANIANPGWTGRNLSHETWHRHRFNLRSPAILGRTT